MQVCQYHHKPISEPCLCRVSISQFFCPVTLTADLVTFGQTSQTGFEALNSFKEFGMSGSCRHGRTPTPFVFLSRACPVLLVPRSFLIPRLVTSILHASVWRFTLLQVFKMKEYNTSSSRRTVSGSGHSVDVAESIYGTDGIGKWDACSKDATTSVADKPNAARGDGVSW